MQRYLLHTGIFMFTLVALVFSFLAVMSKPKLIDTDIRDFANKFREYIYRQEQRDLPLRMFDIHKTYESRKDLW